MLIQQDNLKGKAPAAKGEDGIAAAIAAGIESGGGEPRGVSRGRKLTGMQEEKDKPKMVDPELHIELSEAASATRNAHGSYDSNVTMGRRQQLTERMGGQSSANPLMQTTPRAGLPVESRDRSLDLQAMETDQGDQSSIEDNFDDEFKSILSEDLITLAEQAYQHKLKMITKQKDGITDSPRRRKSVSKEVLQQRLFDDQMDFTLQQLIKIQKFTVAPDQFASSFYAQKFGASAKFASSKSTLGQKQPAMQQARATARGDVLSTSTNHALEAGTATLNTTARQIIDELADPETDTQPELRLKEAVIQVLHKESKQRSKENLMTLGNFLQRYEFFQKFKKSQSDEAYISLMRAVKILRVEQNQAVIMQGDSGDKFYVLLKGDVGVLKAYFYELNAKLEEDDPTYKVYNYLLGLYNYEENVFWERIPYRKGVQQFIRKLKRFVEKNGLDSESTKFQVKRENLDELPMSSDNLSQKLQQSLKQVATKKTTGFASNLIAEAQSPPKFCIMYDKMRFHLPSRLLKRLCKIEKAFDYSTLLLKKEVSTLTSGTEFGELALSQTEVRQASIVSKTSCILIYIEQNEFQRVVKRAIQREAQIKMQFVKANRIFEDVSTGRLQKLSYHMKQIKLVKNQCLYKEGEIVDGIYIVQSGTLQYSKNIPFIKPITATTKNRWFEEQAKAIGVNQKSIQRQIAIFSISACIGFEEIFRQFILDFQRVQRGEPLAPQVAGRGQKKQQEQKIELQRDFTCKCDSITAEVLFLSNSLIQPIMKMHGIGLIEQLFRERRLILNKTLDNIDVVASKIAGLGLESAQTKQPAKKLSVDEGQSSPETSPPRSKPKDLRSNCLNHSMFQESQNDGENSVFFQTLQHSKISVGTANHANSLYSRKKDDVAEQQAQSLAGFHHQKSDMRNYKNQNSHERKTVASIEHDSARQSQLRRQSLGQTPHNQQNEHGGDEQLGLIRQAESAVVIDNSLHTANLERRKESSGVRFPQIHLVNQSQELSQRNSSMKMAFPLNVKQNRLQHIRLTEQPSRVPSKPYQSRKQDSYVLGQQSDRGFPSPSQRKFESRASSIEPMQSFRAQQNHQKSRPQDQNEIAGTVLDKIADKSVSKVSKEGKSKLSMTFSQQPSDARTPSAAKRLKVAAQRQVLDYIKPDQVKGHRRNQTQSIDFVQQLRELRQVAEQEETFEFAQNINKENVIDERLFDFKGGKVKIINKSQDEQPEQQVKLMYVEEPKREEEGAAAAQQSQPRQSSVAIGSPQRSITDQNTLFDENKDSSHLYLQDVKSFMNLRNAALNFKQKKKIQNNSIEKEGIKKYVKTVSKTLTQAPNKSQQAKMAAKGEGLYEMQRDIKTGQMVMGVYEGHNYHKTILQGTEDFNPHDQVTNQLNMKLIAVLQGLDTEKFYQRKQDGTLETDKQQRARLNRSLEKHMNTIDETFLGIAEQEKRKVFKLLPQNRKTTDNDAKAKRNFKQGRYGLMTSLMKKEAVPSPVGSSQMHHELSKPAHSSIPLRNSFVPKNASVMRINQDKLKQQDKDRKLRGTTYSMLVTAHSCNNDSAMRYGYGPANANDIAKLLPKQSMSQSSHEKRISINKSPLKQQTPNSRGKGLDFPFEAPQSVGQTENIMNNDLEQKVKQTDGSDYPEINQHSDAFGHVSSDKPGVFLHPLNQRKNLMKKNVSRYHTNVSHRMDPQFTINPQVRVQNQEEQMVAPNSPDRNKRTQNSYSPVQQARRNVLNPSDHFQVLTPHSEVRFQAKDVASTAEKVADSDDGISMSPMRNQLVNINHLYKLDQNPMQAYKALQQQQQQQMQQQPRQHHLSVRPYVINHRLQNTLLRSSKRQDQSNAASKMTQISRK